MELLFVTVWKYLSLLTLKKARLRVKNEKFLFLDKSNNNNRQRQHREDRLTFLKTLFSIIMSLWVDKYRPIELNQCEHVNANVANHLKALVNDGDCPHCASSSSFS